MDDTSSLDTVKFNKALESFNLVQHVNGSTRKMGHTLDLIITSYRAVDELTTSIETRSPILPDHSAVQCKLRLKKPSLERKEINYRKLHWVNMDSLTDDLKQSNFLTTNTLDLTSLTEQYFAN